MTVMTRNQDEGDDVPTRTQEETDHAFTDCVLLVCFFALVGSIVFSRGSKKVLFLRTVQEQ